MEIEIAKEGADVTATSAVCGENSVIARVCEDGGKVLCPIYAQSGRVSCGMA